MGFRADFKDLGTLGFLEAFPKWERDKSCWVLRSEMVLGMFLRLVLRILGMFGIPGCFYKLAKGEILLGAEIQAGFRADFGWF